MKIENNLKLLADKQLQRKLIPKRRSPDDLKIDPVGHSLRSKLPCPPKKSSIGDRKSSFLKIHS